MGHKKLAARADNAQKRLKKVCDAFDRYATEFSEYSSFVYCAGSLGRGDIGEQSDLDMFVGTTKNEQKRQHLVEIRLLACAIEVNKTLGYEPFSNDGEYLKVYPLEKTLKVLGAPSDDSENLFTARMLMLLESKCVCNGEIYNESLTRIIEHYFRDSRDRQSFTPLFLLNDLLRYWRTLCLNYELTRDDQNRPWRKKNINLKFSRRLTVFGTVLPIIISRANSVSGIQALVSLSPHERFAKGLDQLNDDSLLEEYSEFLDDYESFLSWKEAMGTTSAQSGEELAQELKDAAQRFSDFFYKVATHESIDLELKKILML
ncbi:MAG: hypothetical protein OXE97_10610 [Gammaproteobacteria bacterium]|nr:hypothetical protein [Gammaproteobacteria bacterium]MCY4281474.1 hypothetical protein [Gammaproteobacteria bacterium]